MRTLYALIYDDYLIAATEDPRGAMVNSGYWMLDDDENISALTVVEAIVPDHLAERFTDHGTTGQYFSDGYEAYNALMRAGNTVSSRGK